MAENLSQFLALVLTAVMTGISTNFCVERFVMKTYDYDWLTFLAVVVTAGVTIACLVMIYLSMDPKIVLFITIGVAIGWTIVLVIYLLRKFSIDFILIITLIMCGTGKEDPNDWFGLIQRNNIARCVIFIALSAGTAVFHYMSGSIKN